MPRLPCLSVVLAALSLVACGDEVVQGTLDGLSNATGSGTGSESGSSSESGTGGTTDATGTGTTSPTTGDSSAGTTTSAGTTATSTTASTTATSTTATTGEPLPTDCCVPHDTPGCANSDIQACVCAADLYCCLQGNSWDETCVIQVTSLGCGMCPKP